MYCNYCRFWSELVAKVVGGHVQAMCLNEDSPRFMQHTLPLQGCKDSMSGHLGAIDMPGNEHAYDPV